MRESRYFYNWKFQNGLGGILELLRGFKEWTARNKSYALACPNPLLGTPPRGERVEGPGNDFLVGLGNAQGFLLEMTEKGLKMLLRTF